MRKVRIIYWEDSHSGPYIPDPHIILDSSDGLGTPWNRMFGSAPTGPVASSAERRTKTAFINLIARCSDDRKSKHIAKFRADMNATPFLDRKPAAQLQKTDLQPSRQLCRFYPINPYGVSGTHSALLPTVAVRGN
jgi:hypothetical protein